MLIFEKKDNIAYLTLNRPEKFNSINKPLAMEIQKALDDCQADENIRCVVLSGEGKAFCAGQDLGEIVDPNGPPLDEIVSNHYNPIVGGTYTLPRLIGQARASALMMLAEKVPAADAQAMGMIYKAVSDAEFEKEINTTATKLANMPTVGLAYTKKLLNESATNSMEEQLAREHHFQNLAGKTDDYKEGVNAFLEKRKPTFKGK